MCALRARGRKNLEPPRGRRLASSAGASSRASRWSGGVSSSSGPQGWKTRGIAQLPARGGVCLEPILREACSRAYPVSAICVQRFDDSLSSAIRITYRISLRSSSLREPRYPLLRVVLRFRKSSGRPQRMLRGATNC